MPDPKRDDGLPPDVRPAAGQLSQPLDLDSISEQMEQVRAAATALLDKAESSSSVADLATAVEKAAGAVKLAADVSKTRSEMAKIREEISRLAQENALVTERGRSERIRDYVALLTPLVTIVTLAATLVAQNWQFLKSEQNKREEALDSQWRDSIKAISASGALSPGVVALQPFLRSPKYHDQAKDLAVNLLASGSDVGFFASLFGAALTPATWSNLDLLLRLDRALSARTNPVYTKSFDPRKETNNVKLLTKGEVATFNYDQAVSPIISAAVGSVLKTSRPPGVTVDLSGTSFNEADWDGIDFDGASLERTNLYWISLKDAELKGVTRFAGMYLYRTAWWEAKSINRPLLEYLKQNSPFKAGAYGPRHQLTSQRQYDDGVRRLTSQLTSG